MALVGLAARQEKRRLSVLIWLIDVNALYGEHAPSDLDSFLVIKLTEEHTMPVPLGAAKAAKWNGICDAVDLMISALEDDAGDV